MSKQNQTNAEILEDQDLIDANLGCAIAIIDCVRVLAALERTPRLDGETITGSGYAAGYTTRESSIPLALSHALDILRASQKSINSISQHALSLDKERLAAH